MTEHSNLNEWDRRELLKALLGSAFVGLSSGCRVPTPNFSGELLAPDFSFGHRLRDGFQPTVNTEDWRDVNCVIVGGGIAGLSAAWRLQEAGVSDFVVLEIEDKPGGTALSGEVGEFRFPWGAHYVPTPMAENRALIHLFDQMGIVESLSVDGDPQIKEEFLCRDPEERLFVNGEWIAGLYPSSIATDEDWRQLAEFRAEIDRWVEARDEQGRRMFAIPMSAGSDTPEVVSLDQISMADWMSQHGWTSAPLRWLVDYACRDDYGLTIEQTSAWAGVFYFASRIRRPGDESQPVITWPEGNGRIVDFLVSRVADSILCRHAVCGIAADSDNSGAGVTAFDLASEKAIGFRTPHVIFAAPQFLAPHLIDGFVEARNVTPFQYGSWLVANVHLRDRPQNSGFSMCWDNVIYDSKSLGYVVSTHQTGADHGPTVVTWYYPFAVADPDISRQQLLELDWEHWSEVALSDLEIAHPDIRSLVTRIDCMRWGHAMVQPRPGFVWSDARRLAAKPFRSIHFAGTDLSGIALMEEAFFHGVRSAEEVMQKQEIAFDSIL
ncbi:MAG: FAD-dependent oxidoreductase [Planctomycetales bacterium]|nr:FAD-dependent oxidoreductase [Planctomycetales bacterium]